MRCFLSFAAAARGGDKLGELLVLENEEDWKDFNAEFVAWAKRL